MTDWIEQVRHFHLAFGLSLPPVPEWGSVQTRVLWQRLLDEEVRELRDARTLDEYAHELADVIYVALGSALSKGIDLAPVFAAIHRANMAKLGPDGRPVIREDGKVLKPPGWQPADVAAVLRVQGWKGPGR